MRMKIIINKLIKVLDKEISLLSELLAIVEIENKFIIDAKLARLTKAKESKSALLVQMSRLEKQRLRIIETLAENLNLDSGSLRLKKIIIMVEDQYKRKLIQQRKDLKRLTHRTHQMNKTNESLISYLKSVVQESINLLENLLMPKHLYADNGKFKSPGSIGKLISGTV